MATRVQTGQVSFSEFLEIVREDQKADLLHGVIYMASPENIGHNHLLAWLSTILTQFLEERGLGRLTIERVAYRLSEKSAPEPDLAIVLNSRLGIMKSGYVDGAPDVAIEIISPDSVDRDYEVKRKRYEAAGVQEYWIIDPLDESATFLQLGEAGYSEAPLKDHVFESRTLPGFHLDIRWLWQRPLPRTRPIVGRLLGGS